MPGIDEERKEGGRETKQVLCAGSEPRKQRLGRGGGGGRGREGRCMYQDPLGSAGSLYLKR